MGDYIVIDNTDNDQIIPDETNNIDIDVYPVDNFIIGEKMDSRLKLSFVEAEDYDWTNHASIIEICGDYDTLFGANKIEAMEYADE